MLSPDVFWKIVARVQQLRSAEREFVLAQEALVKARDGVKAVLVSAGLDPNKNYRIDEAGMAVVEPPPAETP